MQVLEASKRVCPEERALGYWHLFFTDKPNAQEQMFFDEELAKQAHPALRFFRWATPALSLGFKQVFPSWIDEMVLGRFGIELVRRPTGGGIAVHGSDVSFSAVVPHILGLNMRDVMDMSCQSLVKGLGGLGMMVEQLPERFNSARICYCLTDASPYSLMIGKRKLCGLAIRRFKESWLMQGSILAGPIPYVIQRAMPDDVRNNFASRSISLESASSHPLAYEKITESIIDAWESIWGVSFTGRGDLFSNSMDFGITKCKRGRDAL